MKASEIRDMTPNEIKQKLNEFKQELFNLRFQHEVGQLENSKKLELAKRDVARLKTVLNELESKETIKE